MGGALPAVRVVSHWLQLAIDTSQPGTPVMCGSLWAMPLWQSLQVRSPEAQAFEMAPALTATQDQIDRAVQATARAAHVVATAQGPA